jgi:hypothetical protein
VAVEFWIDPDDECVFRWKFTGVWTLEEYFSLITEAHQFTLDCAPNPVFGIVDLTEMGLPPAHSILSINSTENLAAPNWVCSVLIVRSPVLLRLIDIAQQTISGAKRRYLVAASVEEARAKIERLRLANASNA